jgi:two-component system response regulator FixJ
LTDKEKETLGLLLDGASNKVMAARLDISERAVEMRRASVMKKLQVNSLAELIRRVTQFELLFPQSKPIGRR